MAQKKKNNDVENLDNLNENLEVSENNAIEELAEDKPEEEKAESILPEANPDIDPNNTIIREEYIVNPHLEKALAKQKAKEAKKLAREREKLKKKRLREYKRGPQKIVRYEPNINEGLSSDLVRTRMDDGLNNKGRAGSTKSIKKIILTNVFTFFNMLTIAIAGWLISIQAFTDLFFLVIVTANVIIGIIQEIKAKNTIDKLSLMSAPNATVIRDSNQVEIGVNEIVLDDILALSSGNQIPSDGIVLDGTIEVNESLLTGESDAIIKKPGDLLYSGSFVVSGNCRARVDKVGADNYIEQLTSEARLYKKPKSDLLKSLNWIIIIMAIIIIPIGATLFSMQYFKNGVEYTVAVRKTAGAMVGMIPSGLYLLSSVALAVGVIRLAQNNVMVQELYCIEMLARVNVLCLDKTGTITDGTMSVKNIIEFNNVGGLSTKNTISAMLNALNDSNLTSIALEEKFGRAKRIKHKEIIPFSSQRKFSAVTFDRFGTFILGAPEFVMKEKYSTIKKEVEQYATLGYRVLLLAHKAGNIEEGVLPKGDTEVVSMILIEDNIRPDAVKTINYFKSSGVEVKVISGDNPLTVSKISERAGIENATEYISLDGLTDDEVVRAATKYTVFGRVSPNQKKLLIKTLKDAGKTVAMTGDGVNDILALKEADCSIAVASGSEAARNVSHLVLLDSNFDSMPKVVAEGRRVINNVSSVACLFLTKTIFSFLLAIQAINSGGTYPISTNQLIMIDFLVTGVPSFFLVLEPNNKEVDGRFFINILKGAIPGAVAILISSTLAFELVKYLGLDFLTSSTIIVIMATHTCMMVLFRVCKPFNTMRKILCGCSYTLFVILTVFMPNFFEFRPFFKFTEYYSNNVEIKSISEVPSIAISGADYYVLDGFMTDIHSDSGASKNPSHSSVSLANKAGYLVIDNHQTEWKIQNPNISLDVQGNLYFHGYTTDINRLNGDNIQTKAVINPENGNVNVVRIIGDSEPDVFETSFNVLPEVKVETVQNRTQVVINNKYYIPVPEFDITVINKISVIEHEGKYVLGLNDTPFEYLDDNRDRTLFVIEAPGISYAREIDGVSQIILGAEKVINQRTNEQISYQSLNYPSIEELYNELDNNRLISFGDRASTYSLNMYGDNREMITTRSEIIRPTIEISTDNRYVIDGKYTSFNAQQIGGDASTKLTFTEDGYLVINDLVTDYKVNIVTKKGGTVQTLPIPAMLILASLCLLASPLMKLLQGIVPWIKNMYYNIQLILSKF